MTKWFATSIVVCGLLGGSWVVMAQNPATPYSSVPSQYPSQAFTPQDQMPSGSKQPFGPMGPADKKTMATCLTQHCRVRFGSRYLHKRTPRGRPTPRFPTSLSGAGFCPVTNQPWRLLKSMGGLSWLARTAADQRQHRDEGRGVERG